MKSSAEMSMIRVCPGAELACGRGERGPPPGELRITQVAGQHRGGRGQHIVARPLAQRQLELGQLLADRARHAHHEIRVAAARGHHPRPAQAGRADRDRADVRDRGPAVLRGGMRGHLCPHGQGPAVRHWRIGPRREPARAAAAPAALTRYK